ncbi:MAG: hypothetical protein PUF81_02935 [Lachnospiraceae bacterium]|nr:hypothetical protein [Lachnospiraceae bacterium]
MPGGFLITNADAHPNLFGFKCVCSIICGKEGPGMPGGFLITYADAHPNLFGFKCVCSITCFNRSEERVWGMKL